MGSSLKVEGSSMCMVMMFQSGKKRKVESMLQLLKALAVVFILSRSSLILLLLPTTLRALNHPFFAFLLLNSIVLSLYALSNATTNSANSKDVYDDFLLNSNINHSTPDKQSITPLPSSQDIGDSLVLDGTVVAVTTRHTCTGDQNVSEKKSYRRVQSETFERRLLVSGGGPQLRRIKTGGSNRQLQRRLCHVEHLNKEEFNRAVEDFIAKQKRMLWEEQRESNKTEYLAAF